MTAIKLKDLLVNTYSICYDNEYLDQYVALILKNKLTYQTMNTEYFCRPGTSYHHAIPLSVYYRFLEPDLPQRKRAHKARKIADCDTNCFMVLLSYSEHLLAHFYLMLCASNQNEVKNNINALNLIITDLTEVEVKNLLEIKAISENYYLVTKLKAHLSKFKSDATPAIPTVYMHKDDVELLVPQSEQTEYFKLGWQLGGISKNKTRSKQARCHIHKDGVYKNILLTNLQAYLDEGWEYGAAGKPRKKKSI